MERNLSASVLGCFNKAVRKRQDYDPVYQIISEFFNPRSTSFNKYDSPGIRRDLQSYDSTPAYAANTLASMLHTLLTQGEFFRVSTYNPELLGIPPVKVHVGYIQRALQFIFDNPKTGFKKAVQEFYQELVTYGTSTMYIEDSSENVAKCRSIPSSEVYFLENQDSDADIVFRKFKFTVRAAKKKFGNDCFGDDYKINSLKLDDELTFVHVVMPRSDWQMLDGYKDVPETINFKYPSCYICLDSGKIVQRKGYSEMPYIIVPFWKLSGEIYGRSPAWNLLSTIGVLNKAVLESLRAVEKAGDPPILTTDDGVMFPLNTHAGGVIVGGVDPVTLRPTVMPFPTQSNPQMFEYLIEKSKEMIKEGFFIDKFDGKDGTPITATEAADKQDTRLMLLAPTVDRLHADFLTKLFDRVYGILERSKALPEPPIELDGIELKIDFISPLSRAQRMREINAYGRALQVAMPIMQMDPNAAYVLNSNSAVRHIFDASGVPLESTRSDEEIQSIVEQAQQAQAQQAEMDVAMQASEVAKNMRSYNGE